MMMDLFWKEKDKLGCYIDASRVPIGQNPRLDWICSGRKRRGDKLGWYLDASTQAGVQPEKRTASLKGSARCKQNIGWWWRLFVWWFFKCDLAKIVECMYFSRCIARGSPTPRISWTLDGYHVAGGARWKVFQISSLFSFADPLKI